MEINGLAWLVPIFLSFVLFEWYKNRKENHDNYSASNTMNNLGLGIMDQLGAIVYLAFMYMMFTFLQQFAFFEIGTSWWAWLLTFLVTDFTFYVYHRASHEVNIFWAAHITHHQSEKYNFTVAFRLSSLQAINRFVFWSILPLLGFEPLLLVICYKIMGIYTFFLHTAYIPKLGFLENILITPSTHRVHHGSNEQYLDKNYGAVFVFWDKLFGTYEPEEEKVSYGLASDYVDKNPLHAIIHHYQHIFQTWRKLNTFSDKMKLLFYKPSWHYKMDKKLLKIPPKPLIPKPLKQYAIFIIVISLMIFFGMRAYSKDLAISLFLLYSFYLVTNSIVAGYIFNNQISPSFIRLEKFRNSLFAIVFGSQAFINEFAGLYLIVLISVISIIFCSKIKLYQLNEAI